MAAGPYSQETRWKTNVDGMVLQPFGEVTIAFHKKSGDTHILNFLSEAILQVLTQNTETFLSVVPKVLDEIGLTKEDCPSELVRNTILQLDEVGLVVPEQEV